LDHWTYQIDAQTVGNSDTKLQFRQAIIDITSKSSPIDAKDNQFWDQFWSDSITSVNDVFALIPSKEIRSLKDDHPANLATLVYKAIERLVRSTDSLCNSHSQQITVLNATRILTRVIPYIFEDPDWKGFFWSSLSGGSDPDIPLALSLITSVCDLLFCGFHGLSVGEPANTRWTS